MKRIFSILMGLACCGFVSWAATSAEDSELGGFFKEYLEERTALPEPRRGGKARRLFRLTAAGIEALETSRRAQAQMWKGLILRPLRGGR